MELPDRLKETADEAIAEEDVLAPHAGSGGMFMNMNQSIFGLIAAAGSKVDFNDRFEGQSSDEEEEADDGLGPIAGVPRKHQTGGDKTTPPGAISQTTVLKKPSASPARGEKKHRRNLSDGIVQSVPLLKRLATKSKSKQKSQEKEEVPSVPESREEESVGAQASPTPGSPNIEVTRPEGRVAPVMGRMLEARAAMAARPSFDLERSATTEKARGADDDEGEIGPTELAKRLKDIFEFDKPEEVIEGEHLPVFRLRDTANFAHLEYPCWLMQHVLLQGYMYITAQHVCFYSYLPKKAVSTLHLHRRGEDAWR